ncbi:hypothetical protein ACVWYH_006223 [Bradyrhizobium sp. GM24.11]
MSTYFVSGLALTTFIAGSCTKRVFVYRAHREMSRLYGADWAYADNEQPSPLTKFCVAALVVFIVGLSLSILRDLP